MVPELLVLAVEFNRAPLRFGHLTDSRRSIPETFGPRLLESVSAMTAGRIQATADALSMTAEELEDAFKFFLRQTLLLPQADYYRVLGLSRNCSQATIKRHHSLLVRMFHPDRNPDQDDRSIILTARINAAYNTLRDPRSRRRYDQSLPPSKTNSRSATHGPVFVRPHKSRARFTNRARFLARLPIHANPAILWILGCAIIAGLLFAALREPQQPLMQISSTPARKSTPGPSYLRQADGEAPSQARLGPTPMPLPAFEDYATEKTAPVGTALRDKRGDTRTRSQDVDTASQLVTRFQRFYENGDLTALTSLFTADAATSHGAGLANLSRTYSEIFASAGERSMSIFNLKWRAIQDQSLLGSGDIRISRKPSPHADWRHARGTVELKLVPWMDGYKIAKIVHRIARN